MPKTIHRHEYKVAVAAIKERREQIGMTQAQCSKRSVERNHSSMTSSAVCGVSTSYSSMIYATF